jgi:hypothetical protein
MSCKSVVLYFHIYSTVGETREKWKNRTSHSIGNLARIRIEREEEGRGGVGMGKGGKRGRGKKGGESY